MRASLASLLLWSVGTFAETALAKICSYDDDPELIAHTGTPVGTIKTYQNSECPL